MFSRTSDPNIYAVGDAVEMSDDNTLIPPANIANRQDRLVADHFAGRATAQRPHFGTAILRVFGLQVGVVGWNEKRLRAAARDHLVVHAHPTSPAGYFPDDLAALALAYAPQHGSAKDPINMPSYIAGNRLSGDERSVQWHELAKCRKAGVSVVDARDAIEREDGFIPGSIRIASMSCGLVTANSRPA